ncbi:ATP-binding protein [Aureimonas pseudogalii]
MVLTGRGVEQLSQSDYFAIQDGDAIIERAETVAILLRHADEAERPALVGWAADLRLDLALIDDTELIPLITKSSSPSLIDTVGLWLFPSDRETPPGGQRFLIDGHSALSLPIDGRTVLLIRNLPDTFSTNDFISPLSYYVLGFLTLLLFFSIYAVRSVTAPLARMSDELNRSDGVSEDRSFAEAGTAEVVDLARALNGMRIRIREMVDTRTRMLRSVSHDLRTPLTRLRLRTERLDGGELREVMLADIDHINALVEETLDYLRTDASGEELERTDIASLMQTIQANFSDVGFAVTYVGPDRLIAMCKPNAFIRAVTNLCDNAVKFGNHATISLSREDSTIRVDVADNGPGIPSDRRQLVLEPFFKLDAARGAAQKAGLGLGLSIVADIVRAHGGRLEFHDNRPRGLIVRVLLPAA